MSFASKIKEKFTGAALATTLAVSTALAPSFDANAQVIYTTDTPATPAQAQALSQSYADQDKDVVVLHKGKKMNRAAENAFNGMLAYFDKDKPEYKIQVLEGGPYEEAIVMFHEGKGLLFNDETIKGFLLHKHIVETLEQDQTIARVASAETTVALNND